MKATRTDRFGPSCQLPHRNATLHAIGRLPACAWTLALLLILIATTLPAFADGCIPYCNVGTIAPTNIFTATQSADVTGYFVGSNAGGLDFVRMLDINTGWVSPWLLDNQTSHTGDMADFGFVNAGDTLVFEIENVSLGSLIFASDPSFSEDGENHAYATSFSGGILNGYDFPPGTYVGMEDLPAGQSDWDYNDDTFLFTNVSNTQTPEPGTLLTFASGLLGLAGFIRRKRIC